MKKLAGILLVLIFALAGCSGSSYETVDVAKAKELVDSGEIDGILDVRTPEEYQAGHIDGAVMIPIQVIESEMAKLDKDKTYLVYCRSGNRSQQASEILSENGFKQIYNMSDGYSEW
jgi:rhodanese-related sulfurtransferase